MSRPPNFLVLPQAALPAEPNESIQQLGAELRDTLRCLRAAPRSAHAGLRLHLRERLEASRAALIGSSTRLPATLRHYAVSLTEVQWLLDAWIAGSEAGGEDEAQLQREFFHAASRLFDEDEEEAPPPAPAPWWARCWTALRRWGGGRRTGRSPHAEEPGPGAARLADHKDASMP